MERWRAHSKPKIKRGERNQVMERGAELTHVAFAELVASFNRSRGHRKLRDDSRRDANDTQRLSLLIAELGPSIIECWRTSESPSSGSRSSEEVRRPAIDFGVQLRTHLTSTSSPDCRSNTLAGACIGIRQGIQCRPKILLELLL
jgi:hypothetical protein